MIFENPEFFDIFGFAGFIFIIFFSLYLLKKNKVPPKLYSIILLIIGILGLIIDGAVIFFNYLN